MDKFLRKLGDPAKQLVTRVARRVSLEREKTLRNRQNVDIVLSAGLREALLSEVQEPVAYVEFLRGCIEYTAFSIVRVKESASSTPASARFQALLGILQSSALPLPFRRAQAIGLVADKLSNSLEPLEGQRWATDVGLHCRISSSFAKKGRLISNIVRVCRVKQCLELGTAYGMSALFILNALRANGGQGHLTTVEGSEPQFSIASGILQKEFNEMVSCHFGRTEQILPNLVLSMGSIDFLFHDAGHSREDYTRDFGCAIQALAQGSVVLFDDIRWNDPRFETSNLQTYRGWQEVIEHPRVRQAVEIDDAMGLILIE